MPSRRITLPHKSAIDHSQGEEDAGRGHPPELDERSRRGSEEGSFEREACRPGDGHHRRARVVRHTEDAPNCRSGSGEQKGEQHPGRQWGIGGGAPPAEDGEGGNLQGEPEREVDGVQHPARTGARFGSAASIVRLPGQG